MKYSKKSVKNIWLQMHLKIYNKKKEKNICNFIDMKNITKKSLAKSMKYSKKCEKYNYDYWTHYLKFQKKSICFPNICLEKCFEISPQKSLAKSKNYSQKICENIWIQNTLSKIPPPPKKASFFQNSV